MIDFTIPDALQDVLGRVRAYVTEDVLPAKAQISDPDNVLSSRPVVERLRERARERGIYGASEVHRMTIARELLKLSRQGQSTQAGTGDLR